MEKEGNKITIASAASMPGNLIIGDKIFVTGCTMSVGSETISCDGEYTVLYISGKEIGVSESIPYDYPQETGLNTAQLYKELYVGEIVKTENVKTINEQIKELNPDNLTVHSLAL